MSALVNLGVLSMLFTAWFTMRAYTLTDKEVADGGQTRRQSIIEAWVNIAIGFSINFVVNLYLLPMVGAKFTLMENLWLGWIYTGISIVRSYTIRRWFNARIQHFAASAAERLS